MAKITLGDQAIFRLSKRDRFEITLLPPGDLKLIDLKTAWSPKLFLGVKMQKVRDLVVLSIQIRRTTPHLATPELLSKMTPRSSEYDWKVVEKNQEVVVPKNCATLYCSIALRILIDL